MGSAVQDKRFKIGGKVYRGKSIEDITLDDLIVFDDQAREAGLDVTFEDVEAMAEKEENTRREYAILMAVTVWLMRRGAGEDITLNDAKKTQLSDIDEVAPAEDKKAPKASKKSASRKGSGRAALRLEPDPEPEETPPTSDEKSATA